LLEIGILFPELPFGEAGYSPGIEIRQRKSVNRLVVKKRINNHDWGEAECEGASAGRLPEHSRSLAHPAVPKAAARF